MYTICFEVRISSSEFELHKMKFGLDFVCYTWFRCIARNWYLDWIQHRDSEKNECKTELSISIDWIGLENGNLIGLTIINMIFISMSFFLKGKIFFPFLFSSFSSKWNNLAKCEWVENVVTNRPILKLWLDFLHLILSIYSQSHSHIEWRIILAR